MGEKRKMNNAVKIVVGGVEWYYQTFYDGSGGAIDCVNLYDSAGSFVRSFLDFNDLMESIQDVRIGVVCNEDYEKKKVQDTIVQRVKLLKGDMSIREFANKVDLHNTTVYNYIAGKRYPTTGALKKIADHTGVTVDWLLGRE